MRITLVDVSFFIKDNVNVQTLLNIWCRPFMTDNHTLPFYISLTLFAFILLSFISFLAFIFYFVSYVQQMVNFHKKASSFLSLFVISVSKPNHVSVSGLRTRKKRKKKKKKRNKERCPKIININTYVVSALQ